MAQVLRTTQAEQDLIDILTRVSQYSPSAADRLADEIDRMCGLLASQPGIGRRRPDLGPGLMSFPVRIYLLVYRKTLLGIEILRVVDGRRDLGSMVFPGSGSS